MNERRHAASRRPPLTRSPAALGLRAPCVQESLWKVAVLLLCPVSVFIAPATITPTPRYLPEGHVGGTGMLPSPGSCTHTTLRQKASPC
ncbi:hypothetical protein E2C01_019409 [Portunus trituberculatus]|uniref:Uncharacterized protein n=1 Tax=Portunus trituberculatus TaxID=210409 RepID=A0A5B7DX45_PORTR|nr:hypothetical protein [Portunus trituberculatus]